MNKRIINLHLISDSTGETLSSVSRAVMSQFENIEANEFIWPLTRTKSQIAKAKESIKLNPGIVMYTILEDKLIEDLRSYCNEINIPCISVLSRIISEFSNYLGSNINLNEKNPIKTVNSSAVALLSEKFDWSKEDRVPDLVMNEILWQGVKGKSAPSPIRAAFLKRSHKEDRVKK